MPVQAGQGLTHHFDINAGICHQVMPEVGLVYPRHVWWQPIPMPPPTARSDAWEYRHWGHGYGHGPDNRKTLVLKCRNYTDTPGRHAGKPCASKGRDFVYHRKMRRTGQYIRLSVLAILEFSGWMWLGTWCSATWRLKWGQDSLHGAQPGGFRLCGRPDQPPVYSGADGQ